MQEHWNENNENLIKDIWSTGGLREDWFGVAGEFTGGKNGCILSFCSDGVNPYKNLHLSIQFRQ